MKKMYFCLLKSKSSNGHHAIEGMYEDLKDMLGCGVDLITDGGLLPFARESADRNKLLIYEITA